MPNPVNATDEEARKDEQVTFRLTQARHRAALRTLAKARGLTKHALAKEMLESALEATKEHSYAQEMLRLEVQELRQSVERIEQGLISVLTGLVALTPNKNGERLTTTEAREYVAAAFSEKGE